MRRILLPSIGAFVLALVLAPQAFADQQLVVDKDKVQCPHADHTSIQAAVNAAAAGGTILVCPDVYNEHVLIATPAKNGLTIRARGRPEEVVLDGLNTMMHGFELENVSGVLIEGFHVTRYHDDIWLNPDADGNTIRRNMTTFAFDHDGIVVQGDHNVIEHNRSFGNTQPISCGISVGSGGSFNIVRFNRPTTTRTPASCSGAGSLGLRVPATRSCTTTRTTMASRSRVSPAAQAS